MNNNFIKAMEKESNYKSTENGATAYRSTLDAVYDLFAFGGAYRNRSDDDCIFLFKKAFEENEDLALKCLFYLRDVRGGAGERRFFRLCMNWLAKTHPETAFRNIDNIPEYGRWDDLYCLENTELEDDAFDFMKEQLILDLASLKKGENEGVSLLGKWLKSINASSEETKRLAEKTKNYFGYSYKKYRKILSALRTRINIVEKLMSEGKWEQIEFEKLPSKAGFNYKNAFAKHDTERYNEFINSKETKVNAGTLAPYEIVKKVMRNNKFPEGIDRATINKYWENQKDYLNGKPCSMMCVIDTSSSMTWTNNNNIGFVPLDVAIALGMYCAERIEGEFKDYFITFSSRPQLIKIDGVDFCDKVRRIYNNCICENTNLTSVFNLFLDLYQNNAITAEDIPDKLVIISDMEIDSYYSPFHDKSFITTELDMIRRIWSVNGLKAPDIIYWNVNARNDTILDDPDLEGVSYVSGCTPVLFQQIVSGKSGKELMIDKLVHSGRYANVK